MRQNFIVINLLCQGIGSGSAPEGFEPPTPTLSGSSQYRVLDHNSRKSA
jgi:hypothetical protein